MAKLFFAHRSLVVSVYPGICTVQLSFWSAWKSRLPVQLASWAAWSKAFGVPLASEALPRTAYPVPLAFWTPEKSRLCSSAGLLGGLGRELRCEATVRGALGRGVHDKARALEALAGSLRQAQ